jgi:hypothetical protein
LRAWSDASLSRAGGGKKTHYKIAISRYINLAISASQNEG